MFSGFFVGYSEEGEVDYRLYIPNFKEVLVGKNVTFLMKSSRPMQKSISMS